MAAFRTPPERLLRPLVKAISVNGRQFSNPRLAPTGGRMFRAAVCKEIGKKLVVETVPAVEKLQDSQVRVAVHFCGINFSDILISMGLYQEKPTLPAVLGNEFSGEVIETGPSVTNVQKGDRVLGVGMGAFGEECVVHEGGLWPIPKSLDFREAAALPVSYGTAYVGLVQKANTKQGQTVLVTAAAGALGLATVDIAANALGAKVIGAAGSTEKLHVVKEMGAAHTIDYKTESIREKTKEFTNGRGANVIMEQVGGDTFKECLRSIAWDGYIIPAGFASGEIPKIPANILLVKNCNAVGLFWGAHSKNNPPLFRVSVLKVLGLLEKNKLKGPYVSSVFTLDKINEAFDFVRQRKSVGKVVLQVRY